MNKKRIVGCLKYTTLAITVILVLNLTIGMLFLNFGTPIGLLISKYKLNKYSKAVYGEHVLPDGLPKYNAKDGEYSYELVTTNNEVVAKLYYEIPKDLLGDSNFKVEFDLLNEIKNIDNELGEDIYLPQPTIVYWIDGSQNFSQRPLKRIDKLYLLSIKNTNVELTLEQSKEEFFNIVSLIYEKLGNKYNFTSSQIIYTDVNGTLETYMSAKESKMDYEKIKSRIKLKTQEAELDMRFISQLRDVKNGELPKDMLQIKDLP